MPDASGPQDAENAPGPVEASDMAPPDSDPAGTEPADPEATGAESDPDAGFANRAARRARGKGTSQPQPHGKGKHFGGRGSVQGPRQWGNRRSG